jgi:hypothetical protein
MAIRPLAEELTDRGGSAKGRAEIGGWGISMFKLLATSMVAAFVVAGAGAAAKAQSPLERGKYLVNTLMTCHNCHTPRGPNGPMFDKGPIILRIWSR